MDKIKDTVGADYYEARIFQKFDEVCDAWEAVGKSDAIGSYLWTRIMWLNVCLEDFGHYAALILKREDRDPEIAKEILRHYSILIEIGLCS